MNIKTQILRSHVTSKLASRLRRQAVLLQLIVTPFWPQACRRHTWPTNRRTWKCSQKGNRLPRWLSPKKTVKSPQYYRQVKRILHSGRASSPTGVFQQLVWTLSSKSWSKRQVTASSVSSDAPQKHAECSHSFTWSRYNDRYPMLRHHSSAFIPSY